jgi:hypothetical protein
VVSPKPMASSAACQAPPLQPPPPSQHCAHKAITALESSVASRQEGSRRGGKTSWHQQEHEEHTAVTLTISLSKATTDVSGGTKIARTCVCAYAQAVQDVATACNVANGRPIQQDRAPTSFATQAHSTRKALGTLKEQEMQALKQQQKSSRKRHAEQQQATKAVLLLTADSRSRGVALGAGAPTGGRARAGLMREAALLPRVLSLSLSSAPPSLSLPPPMLLPAGAAWRGDGPSDSGMALRKELSESAACCAVCKRDACPNASGSGAAVAWAAPTTVARATAGAVRIWAGGGCSGCSSCSARTRGRLTGSWYSGSCSPSSPSLSVRCVCTAGGCWRGLESGPSSFLRWLGGGGSEGMSGNLRRAEHCFSRLEIQALPTNSLSYAPHSWLHTPASQTPRDALPLALSLDHTPVRTK